MKVGRRLRFGPFALHFKFRRSTRITRGTLTRPSSESSASSPESLPVENTTAPPGTAIIVGVGEGLGYAMAYELARAGFDLALLTRDADRLSPLCRALRELGVNAESYGMDATDETAVNAAFAKAREWNGCPTLVIYSLQEFGPGSTLDVSVPAFESAWKHNCFGAFLVSQAAGRAMKPLGRGSIFLIGSTSSIIGRADHLNLAVGKFGQRALAQVLSRELWPSGIHVAHIIIDADIAEPNSESNEPIHSDPADIAASVLALHRQPRTAWSSEIDLRPWNEKFWEHC